MGPSLQLISATGNRFVLVDCMQGDALTGPSDLAMWAGEQDGLSVDGLLQLLPPTEGGHCRMVIHNVDGSRAEACGNGLRCIGLVAVLAGYVNEPVVRVETDSGERTVEVLRQEGDVAYARTSLGTPEIVDREVLLDVREGVVQAIAVLVGNPHCVLFVPDVKTTPVRSIGEQIEGHKRFPDRINVEFVDVRKDKIAVRIWERGVGETESCGTGVAASAVASIDAGRISSPVSVETGGGQLVVLWDGPGEEVFLEGEVRLPVPCDVPSPLA